jgi:para-nitrobenzyl esterase
VSLVSVTTKLGALEGEALSVNGQAVLSFRSIPYAAPPVGARRFRAPEPPLPWVHKRDARTRGPTAPQILGVMRDLPDQSEDCLHLNVWTPGLTGARPVIAFFHGGAFVTGSSQHTMYDAHALAQRGDVVVVSFNYRLGALGYADLGALGEASFDADANNGLRDQIAALQWIREHIDAFGGDPENVTLLGQSAGAMSVSTLLSVPSAYPLYRRVIAQSGGAHHVTNREHSARMARLLLDALKVSPRELHKLRELPFAQIAAAQAECMRSFILVGPDDRPLYSGSMTLIPVVDGELIPRAPIDTLASGQGSAAPLLTGSNRDENRFWTVLIDSSKLQTLDETALHKIIDRRLPDDAERVIAAYRARMPSAKAWEVYSAIETDRMFRLPATRIAQARAPHRQSTFLYAFDFVGPLFDGELGACHTMEVPFVFGIVDAGFGRVFTGGGPDAQTLSDRILDAWLSFVRTDAPSCASLGPWPAYAATPDTPAMRLGREPGLQPLHHPADTLWDELV